MSASSDSESQSTNQGQAEEIVEKKTQRSSAFWRYFGYLASDKRQSNPVCKLCRKQVPTKTDNTTNLSDHLKQCHPSEHAELQTETRTNVPLTTRRLAQPQQQTVVAAFASAMAYDKKTKRHNDITNTITYFVAKDMLPISTVEKLGFKQLIKVINLRYQLPGRKHFSQTALPKLYMQRRDG